MYDKANIMETTTDNKSFIQPRTIAELLPGLGGILSKSAMQAYSAKKQPRTSSHPRTAEKVFKPLTIAEMKNDLRALKVKSPRKSVQTTSTKKKVWNSSVKLENKTKSCIADSKLRQATVRKVLNFQPRLTTVNKVTSIDAETPKFPKPRPKKSIHIQVNDIRMSGICGIPETPVVNIKKPTSKLFTSNKENNSHLANMNKKLYETPKIIHKKPMFVMPETPLSNISMKSNSDASFLMNEREIDIEERTKVICDEPTLERIAEVSPPVSTPFKEYRSVEDFFNDTNANNSEQCQDNTIMSFDNVSFLQTSNIKDNQQKESVDKSIHREENAIISLCDMLNKASVTTSVDEKCQSTELDELLIVKKQTEDNIKMIENGILTLTNIKESQLESLQYIKKLINQKKSQNQIEVKKETDDTSKDVHTVKKQIKFENNPKDSLNQNRPSVIKVRSPSYKIPKKNACLRKKVFSKSMPNVSDKTLTPPKETNDRAFDMYMKMKEQMNFLKSPVVKHHVAEPNTPSITSHNLQRQLDKLFNCS